MNRFLFIAIILSSINLSFYEKSSEYTYIEMYSALAISEMERTGVPASIKLGQALLESNAGTSTLSLMSNNHFGIKCKTYWEGETYYHKDDDRDSHGKLINSCFRSYDDVYDSFEDHSDFLRNTKNYQKLFELEISDYKGWAYALHQCGYATDKKYADKLIRIIEHFELYQFDKYEAVIDHLGFADLNNKYKKVRKITAAKKIIE